MGKRDSSKTRVVPVFDLIAEGQTSGASWLPQILRLPIDSSVLPRHKRMRRATRLRSAKYWLEKKAGRKSHPWI